MFYKKHYLIYLCVLMLSACGQSNSTDASKTQASAASIGVFLDSPVSGLSYRAKSFSGKTNSKGEFNYLPGEMIRFYIGNINIGNQLGAAVITPLSLVPGAVNELDTTVTNIVRLLMTVDADKNETNGISITDETNQAADQVTINSIDFSAAEFSVNPELERFLKRLPLAPNLVSSTAAQQHFSQTLKDQSNWGSLVFGSGSWKSSVTDL